MYIVFVRFSNVDLVLYGSVLLTFPVFSFILLELMMMMIIIAPNSRVHKGEKEKVK